MALAYLAWLVWGTLPAGFGTGHGYFAVAFMGGPSAALYAISRLIPPRRLVICLRCSWSREYALHRPAKRVA